MFLGPGSAVSHIPTKIVKVLSKEFVAIQFMFLGSRPTFRSGRPRRKQAGAGEGVPRTEVHMNLFFVAGHKRNTWQFLEYFLKSRDRRWSRPEAKCFSGRSPKCFGGRLGRLIRAFHVETLSRPGRKEHYAISILFPGTRQSASEQAGPKVFFGRSRKVFCGRPETDSYYKYECTIAYLV